MGANVESQPCVAASAVKTKPGNTASAPAGLNTRFDIYENGLVAACEQGNGKCSPAMNVIKDVIHPQFTVGTSPNELAAVPVKGKGSGDNCALANGSDPWQMPTTPYLPDVKTRAQAGLAPTAMGHPRDICHSVSADGDCANGRFGNGAWDRDLYFKVNYNKTTTAEWQAQPWLSSWAATHGVALATISRYNVYRAEIAALAAGTINTRRPAEPKTTGKGGHPELISYSTPRCAPGKSATETIKDRRLLTAALVNCAAGSVKGAVNVKPVGWVDLFLVEPSAARARTSADQIYVEVAGVGTKPNGDANTFQYFLRQRPRLVK